MTIGEKIKRLRKERGLTQEELGNLIGVQKAAINKYETGIVVNLKREIVHKLAKALDVNPVWLMDDESGWPPEGASQPLSQEARILARGIDKLSPEQREQALSVIRAMFASHADYFKKENDDET